MPTISVNRDSLFEVLGQKYTDDEFQDLCFQFGLELDEVTSEKQMILKEQGEKAASGISDEILYRIDIPANRYDLLCLEGLVHGLLVFQGKIPQPKFIKVRGKDALSLHITPATRPIRPYAVAAVLNNISFTKKSYDSFIELQEKLHQNICRKRSLVAIGTHDLDTVQGPFVYDALPPSEIKFKALNQEKVMTAIELMELYKHHVQLKQYLPIIRDNPVYPVIKDKNGVVLSMPPIINSDLTKITLNTKNIFIECTATDLTKAIVVLDTITCLFSQYCSPQFTIQECKVYSPDGEYEIYPKLNYRSEYISVEKANKYIGIDVSSEQMADLLSRMCLQAEQVAEEAFEEEDNISNNGRLCVQIPPTRHDVIHAADIYEDLAISFGYNNITRRINRGLHGEGTARGSLQEAVRAAASRAGFTEALTFTLCSRDDISKKMGVPIESVPAVHISNPKTLEFQVVRTTLMPGLLKTLAANKKMPLPLKIFEISDVVLKDPISEVGAKNELRACAVWCSRTDGFGHIHGLLDSLMAQLNGAARLRPANDPAFFPGRCAEVMFDNKSIGKIGVLHPDVLIAFELSTPCSAVEFSLEPFI